VRVALAEGGLIATAAATVFALVMVIVRLDGGDLARGVLACAFIGAGTYLARSTTFEAWGGLAAAINVGTALGFAVALVGYEAQLLFLPVLFVLLTVASVARRRNVLVASLLTACGYVAAAVIANVDDPVRARLLLVVAAGVVVLPLLGSVLMSRLASGGPDRSRAGAPQLPGLTPRQSEVVGLVAGGMRHAEIAEQLGISVNQVRRLLQQARERTGASTTRELVAQALDDGRNGATTPETK
jgi:DNA-binding CsgD family transcriptional regulator